MPPIKLSVNVNKVATLRNSRGGNQPDVLQAVATCIASGAPGITVHPRADARHIKASDVPAIAELLKRSPQIEYNIEGDPRPELLDLVLRVRPTQCTLVPVRPGEVTSQAGWPPGTPVEELQSIVGEHKEDWGSGEHVHRSDPRGGSVGRRSWRRPRRVVHRTIRPGV